jgi:CRP-like cAMP-binding protein
MLTPRYFFTNDFLACKDYFQSQPHKKKSFHQGSFLWEIGEPFQRIHYILSGVCQNYIEHETGHRKIISFHGPGTVFPGYHEKDYKIEGSLCTIALTPMEVWEFSKEDFRAMFETNAAVRSAVIDWFSTYTNLLLYDSAHQEYNNSLIKLCNLLYLLSVNQAAPASRELFITQDTLADTLGMSRAQLARALAFLRKGNIIATHRKNIMILDEKRLAAYCSVETL